MKQEKKGGFLSMLLGILGAFLLENLLTGKRTIREGKEIVRAGYASLIKEKDLIPVNE